MLWIHIYIYIIQFGVNLDGGNVPDKSLQGHDFIMSDHQAPKSWPTNLLLTHSFLFNAESLERPQSR